MSAALSSTDISLAFLCACRLDIEALKPGNVHVYAAGHGMAVDDFLKSAEAAAPIISNPALSVGQRIRAAVDATFAAVGCNTNLGILLLAVPLAAVFEQEDGEVGLADRINRVLNNFEYNDTLDVFTAIQRANPAGLGRSDKGDVHQTPPENLHLLDAMRFAANRDLIAAEYASGFARVRALYRDRYQPLLAEGLTPDLALSFVFLEELARTPDTHILRKHGIAAADSVCERAAQLFGTLRDQTTTWASPEVRRRLLAFDADLKNEGLNPGSLADIAVAVAFLSDLNRLSAATGDKG